MKTGPWPYLQFRKYQKGEWKIVHAKRISDTLSLTPNVILHVHNLAIENIVLFFSGIQIHEVVSEAIG